MAHTLPTGRPGQALAIVVLLLLVGIVWLAVLAPAIGCYQDRAEHLRSQQAIAGRMAAVVTQLPDLRAAAANTGKTIAANAVLPGNTDALAAAALQQELAALAATAGITISSQEILPGQQVGDRRSIAVRLTVSASWRAMAAFLLALAQSATPMITDEMQIRGPLPNLHDPDLPVDTNLSVVAYRAGEASAK